MKVLVACEFSGTVRDAFRARGYDAWSCDILPCASDPSWHIMGDVLLQLDRGWDLMIAHTPCRYLCSSGLHWNSRRAGRQEKTEKALGFVRALMAAPVRQICIENPVGCIGTRIRKANQYVQPHDFGEDASKRTGLWLFGLPPLVPTECIPPRIVDGKKRWSNQTDSGQNRLGPSETRSMDRSRTYKGIALAMAEQWGCSK